ncbi:hypothetical protein L0128_21440 [candidate division KSB1 bacterium]|nr:hypothetical protein [candidate division KSB1 bacterium]
MPPKIILGVYRRLDNRLEGLPDDSPRALELHRYRKEALHEVFDAQKDMVTVLDWGLTDDPNSHEFVELTIGAVGAAVMQYAVVPALVKLGQKLAEKAIDTTTSELVKAIVSWLRPKQETKKILDFVITLPNGTQIKVDPPAGNATITIHVEGQPDVSVKHA